MENKFLPSKSLQGRILSCLLPGCMFLAESCKTEGNILSLLRILRLTICIKVTEADLDSFVWPLIDQWRS